MNYQYIIVDSSGEEGYQTYSTILVLCILYGLIIFLGEYL